MSAVPETSHRAEQRHGRAVLEGVIRWLSATPITMADPSQPGGCLRRWWYRYVGLLLEPESTGQSRGKDGHKRIEHYLTTREPVLTRTEMAGARFLPPPCDPYHYVEHSIDDIGATIAGALLVGDTDLVNFSGAWLDDDGRVQRDPAGTIEVEDWKFTKSIDAYAKTGPALANTPQMIVYGGAWAQKFDATHVRLSHGYFQTQGTPRARKASTRLTRDELSDRWNRVEGLARTMIHAAQCTSPEQVEANTNACSAFRGCPRRDVCTAGQQKTVDQFFGVTMTQNILSLLGGAPATAPAAPAPQPAPVMLPSFTPSVVPQPAPAPVQITPSVQAPAPHVTLDVQAQIAAQRAQLEAEEAAARAAQAAAAPPVAVPFGIREAWGAIQAARRGTPALAGDAAQALGKALGFEVAPGAGLAGSGEIASCTLTKPEQIEQLARELGMTVPAPVLPPDAPPSNPALAAAPVPGVSTPEQAAAFEAAQAAQPGAKKRGRKSNAERAQMAAITGAAPPMPVMPAQPAAPAPVAQAAADEVELYVDAIPSCPYAMLDAYVADVCSVIAKEYSTPDIRLAPKGTPLEFGQWKGALAAVVRARPPAPGVYVVRTAGSEINAIAAEALAPFVVAWGTR